MSDFSKLGWFAGGVLAGTVGLKLIKSKDAHKVFVQAAAAGLRAKDSVMKTVTAVQEDASDILASAKELNEKRAEEASAAEADAEIADCAGEEA